MNPHERRGHDDDGTMAVMPWFALQVRSRHELGVASHLQSMGYEYFVPLYTQRKRWSDRLKEVESPLFPGYVFCRFNTQNWLPILKTPGVIQVIGYNRRPIPIDDREIEAIRTIAASGLPKQAWPEAQIGDLVRIDSGPLQGLEGTLVDFKNARHFVISVTLLRRSVAVEIDASCVTMLVQRHLQEACAQI